ncbi:MAG: YicC/YloC family endoribonuclease [Flavobacteriaceae bacterium]
MVHSMTGYGRAEKTFDQETLSVEIKSLNSKNLDLSVRLPQALRIFELKLRKHLSSTVIRGKVEVFVQYTSQKQAPQAQLNAAIIEEYLNQINAIAQGERLDQLALALKLPDAVSQEKEEAIDALWEERLLEVSAEALKGLEAFRIQEGAELHADLLRNLQTIEEGLERIGEMDPERGTLQQEKLKEALHALEQKVDENRFEQELIYYLEKFDINEEKVRLKNHIAYFKSTVEEKASGKKLGFIAQELGREINTIGSKANHANIQREVVRMKDALEKIKEQALNVL